MSAKKITVSLDLRWVVVALLAVIIAMLVLWMPWTSDSTSRTITESGQATVKAEPDSFTFNPQFTRKGEDKAAIQNELTELSNTVISKLKELGVEEKNITISSQTYDNFYIDENGQQVSTLSLTIEVDNKDLAQTVQDYLVTVTPDGSLTPYPTFSTEKRKELEQQAKTEALKDAKSRAERTVAEINAKLGKVIKVEDQVSGGVMPYYADGRAVAEDLSLSTPSSSLMVLSGEQEISYTVSVTYEIR